MPRRQARELSSKARGRCGAPLAFLAGVTLGANLLGSTSVVRVPFGQAPPVTSVDASGKPGGFAVQTMEEAARRAGLSLKWLPGSTPEGNDRALEQHGIDLILGAATGERGHSEQVMLPKSRSTLILRCGSLYSAELSRKRTEEEDVAIFRTLRDAVRPGGRVVVETNHRDLMCAFIARGPKASKRLPDGTLFVDEPVLDAISGVVSLNWYWSGPDGSGEKHAQWRCYTPTQMVSLLERAGLRFMGAYQGLSKNLYRAGGADVGGRLAVVGVRDP